MADFKAMSIMMFVVLATINAGIIAFNMSDTGINLYGADANSSIVGLSSDLQAREMTTQTLDTRPEDDLGVQCEGWLPCGVRFVGDALEQLVGAAVLVKNTVELYLNWIFLGIFGFPILLDYLASLIEGPVIGPIHILFGIISISVTAFGLMGLVALFIEIKNAMRL